MPNSILSGDVKQLIQEGRKVTLKVKGNSMRPFIEGDRDSVILTGNDNYQIGDIVLAEISEGNFVLHRIVQINEKEVILMGDGNLAKTESCDIQHLVAKVETIIRKGKQINPDTYGQRTLAKIWNSLNPIRRYLLAIYRRI
jgi:SOS-response transcriptional repressor LexA